MKYDKSFFLRMALIFTDVVAVVASLSLAYYFRVNFDGRPLTFEAHTGNFVMMAISFVPMWLIVNRISGLYDRAIFLYRPREYGRVLLASIFSVMALITFGYFSNEQIFPVRIIPVYFVMFNFVLMIVGRELVRILNRLLLRGGVGRSKVLLVGSNDKTTELADFFAENIDYGYDVIGMVARPEFLPKKNCLI
jgi:FlaA1/EpsC-like NDP-sugar epimerase